MRFFKSNRVFPVTNEEQSGRLRTFSTSAVTAKSQRGFTLVEVLVAVGIISVLASVVIFNIQAGKEKARDAQRISDLQQLQVALRLYKDVHGEYPTEQDLIGFSDGDEVEDNVMPYVGAPINDPLYNPSQFQYLYVYIPDQSCGDEVVPMIGAIKMERPEAGNFQDLCGGLYSPAYVIILK